MKKKDAVELGKVAFVMIVAGAVYAVIPHALASMVVAVGAWVGVSNMFEID